MIDASTCNTWLSSSVTPSAASTAVKPSSSGTPAATSAPNATTRISSVIGTEVASALWKSSLTSLLIALLLLAVPSSPMNSPGWARCTAVVADKAAATRFCAVSGSPVIWKVTSAA